MEANFKGDTPFEILGIEKNSSERERKKAYAALIKKYRPEKFPKEFQIIREAYEQLKSGYWDDFYEDEDTVVDENYPLSEYQEQKNGDINELSITDITQMKEENRKLLFELLLKQGIEKTIIDDFGNQIDLIYKFFLIDSMQYQTIKDYQNREIMLVALNIRWEQMYASDLEEKLAEEILFVINNISFKHAFFEQIIEEKCELLSNNLADKIRNSFYSPQFYDEEESFDEFEEPEFDTEDSKISFNNFLALLIEKGADESKLKEVDEHSIYLYDFCLSEKMHYSNLKNYENKNAVWKALNYRWKAMLLENEELLVLVEIRYVLSLTLWLSLELVQFLYPILRALIFSHLNEVEALADLIVEQKELNHYLYEEEEFIEFFFMIKNLEVDTKTKIERISNILKKFFFYYHLFGFEIVYKKIYPVLKRFLIAEEFKFSDELFIFKKGMENYYYAVANHFTEKMENYLKEHSSTENDVLKKLV